MRAQQDEQEEQKSSSSNQPNFVAIEHEILSFWEKEKCFQLLTEKLRGRPLFRFLDGPITANNPMGVHHAWGRSLKDIYIRYKTLRGYDCQFQNGFDCQGLWVEVEVEKDLGFKGKPDIEAYGLDRFSEACKARIQKYSEIQTEQSIRLGQWMDWSDSYYTHTDKNIEGIWKFLATCHRNGWLYRSGLPMPWCTRCGTSLSEHEMAGSYKDMSHLAVYIKLLLPKLNSRILVWTTTPWTLPANAAVAVNPELDYAQIQLDGEDLPIILSNDVLKSWQSGTFKKRQVSILRTCKGSELVDLEYEPIFADFPVQQGFRHRIVPWEDVDPREGTGVVHIAPGCGREDFELSQRIAIERITPVDEKGEYLKGYGFLQGKNAKQVGEEVASYLERNGKLFSKYTHDHSYPVCWRCKDELIFRLVDEWYISSEQIRPQLKSAASQVHWQPEHVGKRMENWLTNMGDWCISRKRFWGLPLPFYVCSSCQTVTVVESREHLQSLTKQDVGSIRELHRPWIDEVKIECPSCSQPVSRVSEVGDCWLDAGIVPFSTRGCYGRNTDGSLNHSDWAQADWICEMSEQVRLWFYSMLFMGVTLNQRPPYRHVLTYERVLAESGAKFSKTGYMIKFDDAAEAMGVDTMRYYFASQPPTSDIRFGYSLGDETRRQLIAMWNVMSFFNTYAEIDRPQLASVASLKNSLLPIDHWLLASISRFVKEAQAAYDDFNTPLVVREFERFTESLSNWYIRSNRRRFWKSGSSEDKLAGYWALYQAIRSMTVVMAPIVPFVCEKVWQECIRPYDSAAPLSVHTSDWPDLPASWADENALSTVERVRTVINLAHRLRAESKTKTRQPLSVLYLWCSDECQAACHEMEQAILQELNIKELRFLSGKAELFVSVVELDLKKAGPILKGDVGKVVGIVNALGTEEAQKIASAIESGAEISLPGYAGSLPASIFIIKSKARPNIVACEESGLFLALDTHVTRELEHEGWIRDILRQSQVLRKESGLEVQDRIHLHISSSSPDVHAAVLQYRSLIEDETLATLCSEHMANPIGSIEFALGSSDANVRIELTKQLA